MSVKVELEKLLEVAAGFGTVPMLLTADGDGRPRASAVSVEWDGATARVRAGRKSVANAATRPLVSLLWPAPPGERFALLVDGEVAGTEPDDDPKTGGFVTVTATSAILHLVHRPPSP
jgi:Pyridoxamine 5'-phosphate oxidase